MKVLALAALMCFAGVAFCQPLCTVNYAVVTQDTLKNLKFGLSPKDTEWANGLQKKYPGVCYTNDPAHAHVALSIMVFFALCAQCASTLMVIRRETNSWKWSVFTFAYMTVLAYAAAFVVYQAGAWMMG